MRILVTEIIGWLFIVCGLAMIVLVVYLAMQRQIFEATAISFPGIIVFRGGIGFVRMAIAGRIATNAVNQQSNSNSSV